MKGPRNRPDRGQPNGQMLNDTACSSPTDSGYRSVPRLGLPLDDIPPQNSGPPGPICHPTGLESHPTPLNTTHIVTSTGVRVLPSSEPPAIPAKPPLKTFSPPPLPRNPPPVGRAGAPENSSTPGNYGSGNSRGPENSRDGVPLRNGGLVIAMNHEKRQKNAPPPPPSQVQGATSTQFIPNRSQSINQPVNHQSINHPVNHQSINQPVNHQSINQPMSHQSINQPINVTHQSINPPMSHQSINHAVTHQSINLPLNHHQSIDRSVSIDETLHSVSSAYSDDLSSPGSYPNSSESSLLEPKCQDYRSNLNEANYRSAKDQRTARKLRLDGRAESYDTLNSDDGHCTLERCPKLPELELGRLPWSERDVVTALQKGRTGEVVNRISVDVVPKVTYVLQRPLIRIAREAQRLASKFGKLTRHDVMFAAKIILPATLSECCLRAGMQAGAMYAMSGENTRQSKSHRAGLRLSVGQMMRWLVDVKVSHCVHEQAAVFLTAIIECLLEEIVLQSLHDSPMLTPEELELALGNNPDLWGILQPYGHLICGRTANGFLSLPNSLVVAPPRPPSRQRKERLKTNGSLMKNLEQCLLATCIGSVGELADLLNRLHVQAQQNKDQHSTSTTSSNTTSSSTSSNTCLSSIGLSSSRAPVPWSRDALSTLHYYMRCTELDHGLAREEFELGVERPLTLLPPLMEWLRVSLVHCEHRWGACVDQHDVLQTARLLLPGVDCPPRLLSQQPEDHLIPSGRQSPSPSASVFRNPLGFKLLAAGRGDLVPHGQGLLGPQRLDGVNEMGLTPLMIASYRGDETAVRLLLDSGSDPSVPVPAPGPSCPAAPPDLAGWSALTFAVAGRRNGVVQLTLLLDCSDPSVPVPSCPAAPPDLAGWSALTFAVAGRRNGVVQLLLARSQPNSPPPTPATETPIQIAAMVGCPELVNVLLAHGADPFQSTYADELHQRGSAPALCLAASHGHRSVVQVLLARRRGRNEEMLSLEDFLAEGSAATAPRHDTRPLEKPQWSKSQLRVLQEAMYHAAESGHLDILMDLKNLGLPFTSHVWTRALALAQDLKRKALVQLLLSEFVNSRFDEFNQEFVEQGLPLLFDVLKGAKNEVIASQVAEILSQLYGEDLIAEIASRPSENTPRIDPRYVNNPDLSDIQFSVHGRLFYGHKIVLLSASPRFAELIHSTAQGDTVQIDDVTYDVFEIMMHFLYKGNSVDRSLPLSMLLQLLNSAHQFALDDLSCQCEQLISRRLTAENCITVYSQAIKTSAEDLLEFCEGYFLQNLPQLLATSELGFRKLLYHSPDLLAALQATLAKRMKSRRNV